jgi:acetyl esterase
VDPAPDTATSRPTARESWLKKLLGEEFEGGPPITSVEMIPARRAALSLDSLNQGLPELDQLVEGVELRKRRDGVLTAEVHVPKGSGPFPTVLYMHGGAWCVWSARDVRRIASQIAARGYLVVNLDYGLAPELPYPCAVEDAIYGARWATLNAERWGGDASRISVGGDSCGATLACAAIAYLSGNEAEIDQGDLANVPVSFSAALLFYGVYDFRARLGLRDTTPGTMEIMHNLAYLGTHFLAKHLDPLVSPWYAQNLDRFPPVYITCGAQDALLPDSLAMAGRFADAGVSTTVSVVEGRDHEFLMLDPALPDLADEWERLLGWLDRHAALREADASQASALTRGVTPACATS